MIDLLKSHVEAGFSGIWVLSHEGEDAEREIATLCSSRNWALASWDLDRGVRFPLEGKVLEGKSDDPLKPLQLGELGGEDSEASLVVLHNYHRFLENVRVVQTLRNAVVEGKSKGRTYVILSPVLDLPPELEKLFAVLDHPLPSPQELLSLAQNIDREDGVEISEGAVEAARGLTRVEAENAFALSTILHDGKILAEEVARVKSAVVKKKGFLELHQGKEGFSSLKGLDSLKSFCTRLLRKDNPVNPKGILLVGVPGSGKSAFCKALGNEVGLPVFLMDLGRLYSKYVGDTEANLHGALMMAEAMAPCVVMVDEIEKSMAGSTSEGDSGVSARVMGRFLTWMNDCTSPVFLAMSANDVTRLPPEFSRAERVDATFFVDLPTERERDQIWSHYVRAYEVPQDQELPKDDGYTGAEIKATCRLSRGLDVPLKEAASYVVPISVSSVDKIKALREWADGRVLSTSVPGVYKIGREGSSPRGRRVQKGRGEG